MSKEISAARIKALTLDLTIKHAAEEAQRCLYEMCMGFKTMRDEKLYKELGYSSFEDYCEQETGVTRQQVYKYITIVSKLPEDFVKSTLQIGTEKLWLLTTLAEEERTEIVASTDVESASVRELKKEIDELKKKQSKTQKLLDEEIADNRSAMDSLVKAEEKIKELEARPVEVAVERERYIPEDYIHSSALEREVSARNAEREQLEGELLAEKRRAYAEKQELERKLAQAREQHSTGEGVPDIGEAFKAYFTSAYNALNALVRFAQEHTEFIPKVNGLVDNIKESMEDEA